MLCDFCLTPSGDNDVDMAIPHRAKRPFYKRDDLSVCVSMEPTEVRETYNTAIKKAESEFEDRQYDYYKIYLKHMFGPNTNAPIEKIVEKLNAFRETVDFRMEYGEYSEELFVRNLITRNNYVSKSTRRPGVTVKLFHTYWNGRDVMVKTYIYDGECPSLDDRMMACFKDEVLFQYYANRIQTKFISPELYSWGKIRKYQFIGDKYFYKCLYLVMEYITGLTIKESTYTKETMRCMYERVKEVDRNMISAGIHHNDLHGGNVIVVDRPPLPSYSGCNDRPPLPSYSGCNDRPPLPSYSGRNDRPPLPENSPLPEIIILDFGEASLGPRKPLFV